MAKIKKQKIRRPKAETPRGFRDYFGAEVTERDQMLAAITEVYHRYGFDALETSAIETMDALGKHLPDVDRPESGVFVWDGRELDEREGELQPADALALRYDLTAPLARVYAQNHLNLPTPYRRFAVGPVWRNEKPGPGRYRQFYQCDADTVGSASPAADAEICAMLADALEAAGIERGDYVIRINNRKVLNGVLTALGIDEEDQVLRADVLRCIDKFDKVGIEGVWQLLTQGRLDDSGAFIDGVGLSLQQAQLVGQFLQSRGDNTSETFELLEQLIGNSVDGHEGISELKTIAELLSAQGYQDRAIIDPSVVRGLGYYTGPVYEAELTFEITDEKGQKRQFGSVAGGGRYDDLVMRFTGQRVPGTGVSIGVDRLLAALREKRGKGEHTYTDGPVLVTVMDKDRLADYQTMVKELRAAGIRAEMFLGGGNMAKQLKYADKRGCPVAVIEGGNEKDAGIVQLKDLALGARLAAEIETNEEWKAQPAQIEAPRGDLVGAVRAMIARANGGA